MTNLKRCLFLERERDLRPWVAVLVRSWTLCWRSGAAPGAYVGRLGPLLGLCGRSWTAIGPYVGSLGPLLGPMFAVLGRLRAVLDRSWALCWRSWAAPGAYVRDLGAFVGGLARLLGLMLVVLAALGAYVGGPWWPWAEKWPKPERKQVPDNSDACRYKHTCIL